MLTATILNSDATLNNFHVINTLDFIAGSSFTIVIQLKQHQSEEEIRFIPELLSTLTLHLPNKDGTELDLDLLTFDDDRSMWTADVTALQSAELASGNCTFELIEPTGPKTTLGWIQNALALIVTGSC